MNMDLTHKHWALIVIGVLVGAFAVTAIWYSFSSNQALAPSDSTATSTIPASTSTSPTPAAHVEEHAAYYDIDLEYPSATPLVSVSAKANATAVATMKAAMQALATQFLTNGNFANLTHDDIQIQGLDQRKEALGAEYKTYIGKRSVSYVFQIYEDTHGAHPNTYFQTFTFDTSTGVLLKLGDLFADANYIDYRVTLSGTARAELPAIIGKRSNIPASDVDRDEIAFGTEPKDESFQAFYLDQQHLTIIFAPYQVGPYALGTIELPIPFSELAAELKAEYR